MVLEEYPDLLQFCLIKSMYTADGLEERVYIVCGFHDDESGAVAVEDSTR